MTPQRITSKDVVGVKKVDTHSRRGLDSGHCIFPGCEQLLIHPYNDFHMCTEHTRFMHKQQYEFRKRYRKMGGKPMGGKIVVTKDGIARQLEPRGQPTDSIE